MRFSIFFILFTSFALFYHAPVQAQSTLCCSSDSTQGQACIKSTSPFVTGTCRQAFNALESVACSSLICGLASDPTPTPRPILTLPSTCYEVSPPISPDTWIDVCGGHTHCSGYNVCCYNATDCNEIGRGSTTNTKPYDPRCGPDSDRNSAVRTALGCLPTSPQAFVNIAIPWAIGLGSGVAFLLGLYGVLMIVISAGNPEKMQAGKEMITSAIAGLLLIVFAVMILKIIGVDILRLFYWDSGGVDSSFL